MEGTILQFRHIEENMYVYLGAEHNMIFIKTQMVRAKITITTGDQNSHRAQTSGFNHEFLPAKYFAGDTEQQN